MRLATNHLLQSDGAILGREARFAECSLHNVRALDASRLESLLADSSSTKQLPFARRNSMVPKIYSYRCSLNTSRARRVDEKGLIIVLRTETKMDGAGIWRGGFPLSGDGIAQVQVRYLTIVYSRSRSAPPLSLCLEL